MKVSEASSMAKATKKNEAAGAPMTTAQALGSLLKTARDIMRKDKGLNGDLDRLPLLTWIMFLKFLDDLEHQREDEAKLAGKKFRPAIEAPYRWRDWAANPQGITGDELLAFINQDETLRPDGTKGPGLFAYLRSVSSSNGDNRRDVVATVFKGVDNRMKSGYLLRDVINKIGSIHFTSSDELHTLGALYESMLREMRDAAGDSGEFYTPRAVVRFMVAVTDPRLGETVLDPASGTGGFLVESYNYLSKQVKTVADRKQLQGDTIFGCEPKSLPYLLCQMNLLLHGLEAPQIDPGNALRFKLSEIGEKDRVDVILTNPPFGGEEEKGIQGNFPDDRQTAETALLFLQLIMRKLHRQPTLTGGAARAAVVVPHGVLSSPGVAARIRGDLLENFAVKAIVRLPHNVFSPYTDIQTNIIFFERGAPTESIFFCEPHIPVGYSLSKTKPLLYEWIEPLINLIKTEKESDSSWIVHRNELDENLNLDLKNPRRVLTSLEQNADFSIFANQMRNLGNEAEDIKSALQETIDAIMAAPLCSLGNYTTESDERIGTDYSAELQLLGVSAEDGFTHPKVSIGKLPGRYKIIRSGYLAYNPMRINIGSIGVARNGVQLGITSPDYVVFKCNDELLPEFVYHYLRSEAGRHEIKLKTKGSVRFRLYYDQLAKIPIPIPADVTVQQSFVDFCNRIERLQKELARAGLSLSACMTAVTRSAFITDRDPQLFASVEQKQTV
jgi:type I restriction enzyme M protein